MARHEWRMGILALALGLSGCYAATRSTVHMVEADQKLAEARAAGAPTRAVYAWTKADEYLKKARDEWGRSEFESAERLLKESQRWSEEASRLARAMGPADELDALPDNAPAAPSAPKVDDLEDEEDPDGDW